MGFNFLSWINFVTQVPTCIPNIANAAKVNRKIKSKDAATLRLPKSPTIQLTVIIVRLLPIAFFIGSPANKTSEGTIIKPQPIPIKPVTAPVIHPCRMSLVKLCFSFDAV